MTAAAECARVLTFKVGSRVLAVRSDLVRRVAMKPAVTRVPYAPPGLQGLSNLQGEVLPVLSVAAALGDPTTVEGGRRLIVLRGEEPAALAVDAVERLGPDDGTAELLDPAELLGSLLAYAPAGRRAARLGANAALAGSQGRDEKLAVLEFIIGNETYGLPLDAVVEVTEAPEHFTRLPDADPSVLGAALYRDTVLPVVSAAGLLGLAGGERHGPGRLIVARVGRALVGLLVDRPRGILRADRAQVDAPPTFLNRAEEQARIEAVIRASDRLVAVVRPEALLRGEAVARLAEEAIPQATASATARNAAGESHMVFRLGRERYALPSYRIEAVVRLTAKVARLPNLPALMAGVANHRGEALALVEPAVSFNAELGADRRRLVIVIRAEGQRFGLVVEGIDGVVRIDDRSLAVAAKPAAAVFPVAVVAGDDEQPLLVVDLAALEAQVSRDLEVLRREAAAS